MTRVAQIMAVGCLVLSMTAGIAFADTPVGDAQAGEKVFNGTCIACHSLTANRVGPNLSGVYGRKAGSVPDFNYSDAVKSANIRWTDKNIDQWLTSPQKFLPGQRMNISISDPQKRANVIAYLKTVKAADTK